MRACDIQLKMGWNKHIAIALVFLFFGIAASANPFVVPYSVSTWTPLARVLTPHAQKFYFEQLNRAVKLVSLLHEGEAQSAYHWAGDQTTLKGKSLHFIFTLAQDPQIAALALPATATSFLKVSTVGSQTELTLFLLVDRIYVKANGAHKTAPFIDMAYAVIENLAGGVPFLLAQSADFLSRPLDSVQKQKLAFANSLAALSFFRRMVKESLFRAMPAHEKRRVQELLALEEVDLEGRRRCGAGVLMLN